jgi:hypothetical protein
VKGKKKAIKASAKLLKPAKRQESLEQTLKRVERREMRYFAINVLQEMRHELGLPPAKLI